MTRLGLVILLVSALGCVWEGQAGEKEPAPLLKEELPLPVLPSQNEIIDNHQHQFTEVSHLFVDRDVAVMARRSGVVKGYFVERGDPVKKGELLLHLEDQDLILYHRRAGIDLERKEREYQRAQKLFDEKMISESEFDARELDWRSARVEEEIAKEELEKSLVRAPFDGLITERFVKVGQRIDETENLPLFQITDMSDLKARLYLSEAVAQFLQVGQMVQVTPRYLETQPFPGFVEYLSPVVDSSSGTVLAIISVPAPGREGPLRPGAAVSISLNLPPDPGEILVPASAFAADFHPSPGIPARIEVLDKGRKGFRNVIVGSLHGNRIEIMEGLKSGERIVLKTGETFTVRSIAEESDGAD